MPLVIISKEVFLHLWTRIDQQPAFASNVNGDWVVFTGFTHLLLWSWLVYRRSFMTAINIDIEFPRHIAIIMDGNGR